ncbi:UDP-N-acetylmuramoylalanyl-D-glutamyl-2, 6-diaminopimelate--D-alanyl-D-alanine ligase, partial [Desulfovibrio sp. OttesenSCG-928-C14]|nr:UDP-N-acetylmuramoylalanyl-D-glutamyl-2, 6-diaminopimelate--D-alanyl-D-alanine ligase [Desulfovibrio sp. OttesenSCG-928-C14]
TGTAGKTSVKEVLADLLGHYGVVSRNFMNMNNQIGLPVSMLNADEQADYWVLEAGISKAGDMDELGALLRPDLAVILNVGPGHTSGLGDKGVAYHKARFLAHLAEGGQALLNCDYADLMLESQAYARTKSYFSTRRADADFYAVYEGPASAASGSFALKLQGRDLQVSAPFRGVFGAENVAAIAGAASLLGLSPNQIRDGIGETALPAQRFNLSFYKNTVLIDDSYNSNPLSASRMLESAAEMAREKKLPLFLVMGEMGEQDQSELVHRDLGREMAESRAAAIFWKGGQADAVREGLERNEFEGKFTLVADAESFRAAVAEVYPGNGVFLFKGSRSNRLEELVKVFVADYWTDYAE